MDLTAVVYAAALGNGGLGLQAATAVRDLSLGGPVAALGPGVGASWNNADSLRIHLVAPGRRAGLADIVLRRVWPGRMVAQAQRRIGRWAASQLEALRPARVYAFTQVGFESLAWAKAQGVPTVLDNPNGHILGFRQAFDSESQKCGCGHYRGHPTTAMIARILDEYRLADRIRVSSPWAKASMVQRGVPAEKITVIPQPVDLARFRPAERRQPATGPLRICFVGSLDLRKGFQYLLRAARRVGPTRVRLTFVGGTVDRCCKRLLKRERLGLDVTVAAGDPVPVYHDSELFVLASLEDGYGFVTAEALACGLPVVVTDQCGSSALVQPGQSGWIIPSADELALADVLEQALSVRNSLPEMGARGRRFVEELERARNPRQLADWLHQGRMAP